MGAPGTDRTTRAPRDPRPHTPIRAKGTPVRLTAPAGLLRVTGTATRTLGRERGRVPPLQGEHGLPVPLSHALDALHLVDDQAPPPHPREGRVAPEEVLVGRDAHVEAVGLRPLLRHKNPAASTPPLREDGPHGASRAAAPSRHPAPPDRRPLRHTAHGTRPPGLFLWERPYCRHNPRSCSEALTTGPGRRVTTENHGGKPAVPSSVGTPHGKRHGPSARPHRN